MPSITAKLKAGDKRLVLPSGGNTTGSVTLTIAGVASTAFTVPGGSTVLLNAALGADSVVTAVYTDHRTASTAPRTLVAGGIASDPDAPADVD